MRVCQAPQTTVQLTSGHVERKRKTRKIIRFVANNGRTLNKMCVYNIFIFHVCFFFFQRDLRFWGNGNAKKKRRGPSSPSKTGNAYLSDRDARTMKRVFFFQMSRRKLCCINKGERKLFKNSNVSSLIYSINLNI